MISDFEARKIVSTSGQKNIYKLVLFPIYLFGISHPHFTDADFIQWTFPNEMCFWANRSKEKKNGGLIPMIKSQSSLKYLKIMCKLNSTSGKTKSDPFSCWHGSFFRTLLLFAFFSAMREMVLKSIRLNTQWRDLNFCISAPKWACFTEMAWPDPVQKAIQLN